MHSLFDAIRDVYRRRRAGPDAPPLRPLLRRLLRPTEPQTQQQQPQQEQPQQIQQPQQQRQHTQQQPQTQQQQHQQQPQHQQQIQQQHQHQQQIQQLPPRPLLYATPDGALRLSAAHGEAPEVRRDESAGAAAAGPSLLSVARAATEDGVMGTLINICSGKAEDGQQEEEVKGHFTLEERVEALYTVVYLVHGTGSDGGICGCGEGKREGVLGLICKMDHLQISTTACDLLEQVMERMTAKDGEVEDAGEGESVLRAFVAIASAVTLLLGCREPMHWRDDQGRTSCLGANKFNKSGRTNTDNNNNHNDDDSEDESVSGEWAELFLTHPMESEHGCCLCCGCSSLLYQFMMTALTEHGLWQKLWRLASASFLSLDNDAVIKGEHSKENDGDDNVTQEIDRVDSVSPAKGDNDDARRVRLTLAVRLTLKVMTLLLLRCAEVDSDLSSILCVLTRREETELACAWLTHAPHRAALTDMERRIVYTLQWLSSFLVFRRVACYAANAMHVLLVRLLTPFAPSGVTPRVVLEGLLFLPDLSSPTLPSALPVLARAEHALAFPLSLLRGEHSAERMREVSAELTVPAALLTALLLLCTDKCDLMDSAMGAVFAPLRDMCANDDKRGLQAVLAAGLARTHQVMLLLRAVVLAGAENTENGVVPSTLRLETPWVTAFSHLVQPSAPPPVTMPRKHLVAELWTETLTIGARSNATAGSRQRKSMSSFSCVATCPARPLFLADFTKSSSQASNNGTLGVVSSSSSAVQVYVKTTGVEECPQNSKNANDNHSIVEPFTQQKNDTAMTYSHTYDMSSIISNVHHDNGNAHHNTCLSNTADVLPPMVFGLDTVRFGDTSRAAHVRAASSCRPPRIAVETFFVNRDGAAYACVADHVPCAASLQREKLEYSASADMIVMAPTVHNEEWPFSAVILTCATLRLDEVHLTALPPLRAPLSIRRLRVAAKRKAIAVCRARRPAAFSADTSMEEPRNAKDKFDNGAKEKEESRAAASLSQTDEEIDKEINDLDAYVAALRPTPQLDEALEWKEREIAELRKELEQAHASKAQGEKAMHEAFAQRDELRSRLMDARLEVELCHTEIIAPLRREVTQLRKSLTLRNQEMRASLLLCQKLREENSTYAKNIKGVKEGLQDVNATSSDSKIEIPVTDESDEVDCSFNGERVIIE